jgi:hypothetical protein
MRDAGFLGFEREERGSAALLDASIEGKGQTAAEFEEKTAKKGK